MQIAENAKINRRLATFDVDILNGKSQDYGPDHAQSHLQISIDNFWNENNSNKIVSEEQYHKPSMTPSILALKVKDRRSRSNLGDVVALSVGSRTCDSYVVDLSPASAPLPSGLRQTTYTCVLLSSSSITWYRSSDGDALRLGRWP